MNKIITTKHGKILPISNQKQKKTKPFFFFCDAYCPIVVLMKKASSINGTVFLIQTTSELGEGSLTASKWVKPT